MTPKILLHMFQRSYVASASKVADKCGLDIPPVRVSRGARARRHGARRYASLVAARLVLCVQGEEGRTGAGAAGKLKKKRIRRSWFPLAQSQSRVVIPRSQSHATNPPLLIPNPAVVIRRS